MVVENNNKFALTASAVLKVIFE